MTAPQKRPVARRPVPDADSFRRAAKAARNVTDAPWFDWVPAMLDRLATDVPALLAALRAAEAEVERLRATWTPPQDTSNPFDELGDIDIGDFGVLRPEGGAS